MSFTAEVKDELSRVEAPMPACELAQLSALIRVCGTMSFRGSGRYSIRIATETVDVMAVANQEKRVPLDWITPDGMHVTEDFERYARPLIQAELTPIYINGVPQHIHLKECPAGC